MVNKDLYHFVLQYLQKNIKITEASEVLRVLDLQITSAAEFIESYSSTFDVDISNFDYHRYLDKNSTDYQPLTISDLERGITIGRLDTSIIEIEHNDINLPEKQSPRSIILAIAVCIIAAIMLAFIAYYI